MGSGARCARRSVTPSGDEAVDEAVASAQNEWITTAIRYLEGCAAKLPAGERPDSYWADDVVAGIIASARALIGVDELHARTEARYSGPMKRVAPDEEI